MWVAVPFEQELGTLQTTLSAVANGSSKNSRRSLKELSRSLATGREPSRHEERARDVRIEDPDQRPDRARSSTELARQALVVVIECQC